MLLLLITQFEKNNRNLQKSIRTIRFLVNIFLISRIETLILEFKASFPKSKFCFRNRSFFSRIKASFPNWCFNSNLKFRFQNRRFVFELGVLFPDRSFVSNLFKIFNFEVFQHVITTQFRSFVSNLLFHIKFETLLRESIYSRDCSFFSRLEASLPTF